MIYGEIAEDATFRFLSAAMPFPAVFSRAHGRFMDVDPELCRTFPPVGMLPSWDVIDRNTTTSDLGFQDDYQENKWLLMGSRRHPAPAHDGLTHHRREEEAYFRPTSSTRCGRWPTCGPARIFDAIKADFLNYARPTDDVSLVIIKRE